MKRTQILSAATALLFVATTAQAQRGRGDRGGHQDQRGQVSPQDQQSQGRDDRRAGAPQQRGGKWGRAEQAGADQARAEQARADQARAEQARAAELQNQRRAAQLGEQQRELQAREAQQQQFERAQRAEQEARERERQRQASGAFDHDRDDRWGHEYRYNIRGAYRETNQYGVDVLRQAVNQGYQEGFRAGQLDRRDGMPADFRRAFDFESGNFGYAGAYVPQSDYSYYFREGFQRGYDDAYWNRARYGTFFNGNASILGSIVASILGLTTIR